MKHGYRILPELEDALLVLYWDTHDDIGTDAAGLHDMVRCGREEVREELATMNEVAETVELDGKANDSIADGTDLAVLWLMSSERFLYNRIRSLSTNPQ